MAATIKPATLKRAKQTGAIVLANQSLGTVPDLLWDIYDINFDDLTYNDTKLITKLNLSGNGLTSISPKIKKLIGLKVHHTLRTIGTRGL
jgi:Leucine-rich repeat (LRR) protein